MLVRWGSAALGGATMPKLLALFQSFRWAIALLVAVLAAVVFRRGYEELAASIWLFALILVLPMWWSA